MIALPIGIFCGAVLAVWLAVQLYQTGVRAGVELEKLRVDEIFYQSTVVQLGGSVEVLHRCVDGKLTLDEMKDRLRKCARIREQSLTS